MAIVTGPASGVFKRAPSTIEVPSSLYLSFQIVVVVPSANDALEKTVMLFLSVIANVYVTAICILIIQ